MAGITEHHSKDTIKLLFIGKSGAGKTGALVALAAAGYNLRILDFDNGIDIIKDYAINPKSQYSKSIKDPNTSICYETLTDDMEDMGGKVVCKRAQAWQKGIGLLKRWQEGDKDYGPITAWSPQDILVIDSLWSAATAALHYHLQINGLLKAQRSSMDERRDLWATQQLIRNLLQLLYSKEVRCNVIVNSHITYNTEAGTRPQPDAQGVLPPQEGFPAAIGRALGPEIPKYFNSMLIARVKGTGPGLKHVISTVAQDSVLAKSSAPLRVQPEYPLESGLADYFRAVKGVQA